jgi:hypothetical protein
MRTLEALSGELTVAVVAGVVIVVALARGHRASLQDRGEEHQPEVPHG